MSSLVHRSIRFLTDEYFLSDEFFGTFLPIVVYWTYSGMYMMMDSWDKYRLHPSKEAEAKNLVSKAEVVRGVLKQQTVQTVVAILLFGLTGGRSAAANPSPPSLLLILTQFFIAMVVTDTFQYFTHYYLHHNKFLYRHIHSIHHRVVVTHAFGSLYGHPLWDGIIDTISTGLGFIVSGMSSRTAIFFFCFSVVKVVDDHCGMMLPGNPFHMFFSNNSAFHDFHHQRGGSKYNFSQPYFVTWDKIMGTYMQVDVVKRDGGGFLTKIGGESKDRAQ